MVGGVLLSVWMAPFPGLGTATKAGKRLKRSRRLIYKVTTEADVMKLVAAEVPKEASGGASLLFSPGTFSGRTLFGTGLRRHQTSERRHQARERCHPTRERRHQTSKRCHPTSEWRGCVRELSDPTRERRDRAPCAVIASASSGTAFTSGEAAFVISGPQLASSGAADRAQSSRSRVEKRRSPAQWPRSPAQ